MSTNNFDKSDLDSIHNIIQSSMIVYPKEMIITTLRDYFSDDSFYHYSKDQWGFPNTTDHTDLNLGADVPVTRREEGLTTRLFIGENFRKDAIFYPAILVKHGGAKYVPISINRNLRTIQYEDVIYEDGYGNQTVVRKPSTFITAGAWEGTINIDVLSRSLGARDEITEKIAMCFTEVNFETLEDVGIVIKPLSIGAASETEDRNDKLFRQTLTLDIRTEWRREIPIGRLIDSILFSVNFAYLANPNSPIARNLTIDTEVNLSDLLLGI